MDQSNFFLEPLLSCSTRDRKFQMLLKACNEQQAFTSHPENKTRDLIAAINSRLNELVNRPAGIQLLMTFLSQCPDQVFVENCVSWMTQCLKAAVNSQTENEAYGVLERLINMSRDFQELTKSITGTVIPKLLEQLLITKNSIAALKCLQVVLHHYPGPCKVKSKSVQNFLLTFLDVEDKLLVEYAGRCISYLPLLLTSGSYDGSKWTDVQTELCATASTLMYEFFENVHEAVMPPALTNLSAGYQLTPLSMSSPIITYHLLATRIVNILTFLEGMLEGDLQHVKTVRADVLVALAYRVLAVNSKMVSRGRSMEHIALAAVLPDVHVAVFNMLQTLVSCCPGGLIKFGPLFCKLVLQTLKWTSTSSGYGLERPYRHLREAAYKFLESWILRASAGSCVELMAEELVSLMLKDVFQKRETVTLQFQEKGKTQSSKQQVPQGRQLLADRNMNAGPCEAALLTLCALIQTSGSLLKPSLHMRLQEVAVSLLLEIRRSSGPEDSPVPFSAPGCRVQLYRLLLVLVLHPHSRWPPPTQFALSLFAWGQHDTSLEVAGFCNLALACTRQMVHPSQSSHQFPLTVNEMRASVGLPDLDPVQGLRNIQKEQTLLENMEMEAETNFTSPNNRKSLNSSLMSPGFNDVGKNKIVFQSTNSNKSIKNKSPLSTTEVVMNGMESSPHTPVSSKAQQKKLRQSTLEISSGEKGNISNSDKQRKKRRHLEYSVEELTVAHRKTSCKSGDWEVTEVSQNKKQVSKENKMRKSVETSETSVKRKRNLSSTPETERNKARKLEGTCCKSDVVKPDVGASSKSSEQESSISSVGKEPLKSRQQESPRSYVVKESVKSSEKESPGETGEKLSPKRNEKESPSKASEKDPPKSREKEFLSPSSLSHSFANIPENNNSNSDMSTPSQVCENNPSRINDIPKKESNDNHPTRKIQENGVSKQMNTEKVFSIVELDVENEVAESEQKENHETTIDTSKDSANQQEDNETPKENVKEQVEKMEKGESAQEKSPLTVKAELNRYNLRKEKVNSPAKDSSNLGELKSNSGKDKASPTGSSSSNCDLNSLTTTDLLNSNQTSPKKSTGLISSKSGEEKSGSKSVSPIIELTLSSDSEPELLQKKASGTFRRITRSLAKRSSVPNPGSEQCVDIEEIPLSQSSITSEVVIEITRLEEMSTGPDPCVELAESDESGSLGLRIDSDRESLEIHDISNDMKRKTRTSEEDKAEAETSKEKASASSKLNAPKNIKDSQTSDREMEEGSVGMEAVEDSPDVAVEDKETAAKKSTEDGKEGSDSGSADEDILKTFVDVVSPKSE